MKLFAFVLILCFLWMVCGQVARLTPTAPGDVSDSFNAPNFWKKHVQFPLRRYDYVPRRRNSYYNYYGQGVYNVPRWRNNYYNYYEQRVNNVPRRRNSYYNYNDDVDVEDEISLTS